MLWNHSHIQWSRNKKLSRKKALHKLQSSFWPQVTFLPGDSKCYTSVLTEMCKKQLSNLADIEGNTSKHGASVFNCWKYQSHSVLYAPEIYVCSQLIEKCREMELGMTRSSHLELHPVHQLHGDSQRCVLSSNTFLAHPGTDSCFLKVSQSPPD